MTAPPGVSARYELYAHPQMLAARDLLAFTGALSPRTILEPGCGTGLYSRLLLSAFPGASILGVDIAGERVRAARREIVSPRIRFGVADAEFVPPGRYELITSNAAFQWFRRLPRTIARFAAMQKGGGVLSFSFFGPGTYEELDGALRETFGDEARVTASRFAPRATLEKALADRYRKWAIEERRYSQVFSSLRELLRSIKFTETRGPSCEMRIHWSPRTLSRLEKVYLDRHGCIRATYRVYLCSGLALRRPEMS
ncbi:MAG: methyltransferase domain-containing protein [Deltaproteobacteria bacterium]|nr:methyltransferase domain-containing protein [Deltaproteobacteria bacterium]